VAEQESVVGPVIAILERDIAFSGQLEVIVKKYTHKPSKKDVTDLFNADISLALFITDGLTQDSVKDSVNDNVCDSGIASIEWRLFDTMQGSMVNGKRCVKRGDSLIAWAHHI